MSLIKDIHQNLHFPEQSGLVCQIFQDKSENENFLKYKTICSTRPENNRIMMFRDFFFQTCANAGKSMTALNYGSYLPQQIMTFFFKIDTTERG